MTASPPAPYRLSIHASLAGWSPEIHFALGHVERLFHVERTEAAGSGAPVLHYGPDAPAGAVAVPAAVFGRAVSLGDDGLLLDRDELRRIEEASGPTRLLPPTDPTTLAHTFDSIGLIFLLLSRLEERGPPVIAIDEYGRFHASSALQARHGGFLTPFADLAAEAVAAALTAPEPPRRRTAYDVWLTHDVDRLRGYHRPLEPIRPAVGDILRRGAPGAALTRLGRAYFSGEPHSSVERLMAASEHHGLQSRFYFMGPSDAPADSPYAARSPRLLREMTDRIAERGHVVGFHPGAGTERDASLWSRQRQGLEQIVGHSVYEGRQHQLRFDPAETWDIWEQAGMRVDATLHFPGFAGFRAGTCHAYPAYSLKHRRQLALLERPTQISDFGYFSGKYGEPDFDQALAECESIVATTRALGGNLTVLYHTGHHSQEEQSFFGQLLELV